MARPDKPMPPTDNLSQETIARLRRIRHVVLDLDGTIYCGNALYEKTAPFFDILASLGITFSLLTNNSSRSAEDYLAKFSTMGLRIEKEQLYTSVLFAADYLKTALPDIKKIFVLGTESMKRELCRMGFEVVSSRPDAVIAGYDTELSYEKLCRAAYWISRGAAFVSTHPDRFCPTDIPELLPIDCGWFTDFLQQVTGRKSIILGKPCAEILCSALKKYGLTPGEAAMAGDRYDTDVALAINAGAFSVHINSASQEHRPAPDITVPNLLAFGHILKNHG